MKKAGHTPPTGEASLRAALLVALGATCAGCVLSEPADTYPFLPRVEISDRDGGANNANNVVDMPPAEPPRLIFTEVLIDAPGDDPSFVERGEYIEIKNIGDGPANPRNITMFLNDLNDPLVGDRIEVRTAFTPEEVAVVDGLQLLQPGDYFVFVRHEADGAPIMNAVAEGYVYDFGRYADGPTLPHQAASRRRLTIGYRYPNGESDLFDAIEWEGHELLDTLPDPDVIPRPTAFREGEAVGLDQNFETMSGNDNSENWCVPDKKIGNVSGTPGGPTVCP